MPAAVRGGVVVVQAQFQTHVEDGIRQAIFAVFELVVILELVLEMVSFSGAAAEGTANINDNLDMRFPKQMRIQRQSLHTHHLDHRAITVSSCLLTEM